MDEYIQLRLAAACLVRVPDVLPFESPASWISRLAFSQMVDPVEVMRYLEMPGLKDPDLAFTSRVARKAAKSCGLGTKSFRFMRHMLVSLRRLKAYQDTFLLNVDGLAQYRFCKRCLREQRKKYFPLHWRFKAWRWCPTHDRLLDERCPHCDALVVLPSGLVRLAESKNTRGRLDQCTVCGQTLWALGRERRFDPLRSFVTPWERFLFNNGRAVLSALWNRRVVLQLVNQSQEKTLMELVRLHHSGLLPHAPLRVDCVYKLPKKYRHPLYQTVVLDRPPARPRGGLFDG